MDKNKIQCAEIGTNMKIFREAAPSYDRLDVNTVKSMLMFGLARTVES